MQPIWLAAGPVVLTGCFVITAIVQSAIEATRGESFIHYYVTPLYYDVTITDNHAISIKECEAQLLNVSTSNGLVIVNPFLCVHCIEYINYINFYNVILYIYHSFY